MPPRLEAGEVAAGVGLAEELRPDVVAPRHGRKVGGTLLVGAEVLERARHERVPENGRDARCRELLVQDALLERVAPLDPETVRHVAGVVEGPGVGAQRLDVLGPVGDPQARCAASIRARAGASR